MKRLFLFFFVISNCISVAAQWRVGITAGATYNDYSIDNHYMSDWHYKGAWGKLPTGSYYVYLSTLGIMGQYDITDWLGVRADLNWAMKDHRQYRTMVSTDYETLNSYLQLPIMASFSFGGDKIRGFLNTGFYTDYWLSSYDYGEQQFPMTGVGMYGKFRNEFDSERDQRFDFGFVGGAGIEWRFNFLKQNWTWQIIEARVYYSTTSTQKDYMKIKDPRYNTTFALQSGLCYFF